MCIRDRPQGLPGRGAPRCARARSTSGVADGRGEGAGARGRPLERRSRRAPTRSPARPVAEPGCGKEPKHGPRDDRAVRR
eukprot:11103589-Alexandrium_andersonii.AAC.1